MNKIHCPKCDEVLRIADGRTVNRCPVCHARIGSDEPDKVDREELPRRRKTRRKPTREKGGVGGLIALLLLGPVCLILMALAPFDVRGAFAAGLGGMVLGLGAGLGMYFALQHAGRDDLIDEPSFSDQFRLALAQPQKFGTWLLLECLCTVEMIEGFAFCYLHENVWKNPTANPVVNAPPQVGPLPPVGG